MRARLSIVVFCWVIPCAACARARDTDGVDAGPLDPDVPTCVECRDPCAVAAERRSSEGCTFDAVSTLNSLLAPGFDFGVVIGNASDAPADVRISRNGVSVASLTVSPRSASAVPLPFVEEVSRTGRGSSVVPHGAYRIESSRPVAAYQYDPLEYRRADTCVYTGTSADADCFSFTNDASLLLPLASLGTEHVVETVGAMGPLATSFATVVAHTRTHLEVLPRGDVAASGDGAIAAHASGERFAVDLDAGDVLTLVSLAGPLAGTELSSDATVMVVSGSDCAYVPAGFGACDHLEEVMPPISSWGTTAVVAVPQSVAREPALVHVLSGMDGNEVSITGLGRPVTLDRGETFELMLSRDVVVSGTGPLLVAQYLVGSAYFDRGLGHALGDPSMGVAPFVEQFRRSYGFAAPLTYTVQLAAIVTSDPDGVRLDGAPVDDWSPIDGAAFFVARVPVAGGAHALDASSGAGLTLYGLAPFTSYLLPGGMNVETLR